MEEAKSLSLAQGMINLLQMSASWMPAKKISGLAKEELIFRPGPGRNHIFWLLGHLAHSSDIARFLDGSEQVVSDEHAGLFEGNASQNDDPNAYPSADHLLESFDQAVAAAIKALNGMSDVELLQPPAVPLSEGLQEYFPTRLDVVTGFTTHIAYHCGQISLILKMLEK